LAQLLRYGGIGLCCVAVNLVVLYVGTDLLGMHYLVSAGFAFALVAPFGYWLHKYLAFRETSPMSAAQALRYLTGFAGAAVLNVVGMVILVDGLGVQYLLANLVVTGVYFFASYGIQAFWTFARESASH
jgi:putative flippase GtrA